LIAPQVQNLATFLRCGRLYYFSNREECTKYTGNTDHILHLKTSKTVNSISLAESLEYKKTLRSLLNNMQFITAIPVNDYTILHPSIQLQTISVLSMQLFNQIPYCDCFS